MIVTDEEARKKQCPAVGGLCMGNECMAWREDYDHTQESFSSEFPTAPKRERTLNGKGYCGMVK